MFLLGPTTHAAVASVAFLAACLLLADVLVIYTIQPPSAPTPPQCRARNVALDATPYYESVREPVPLHYDVVRVAPSTLAATPVTRLFATTAAAAAFRDAVERWPVLPCYALLDADVGAAFIDALMAPTSAATLARAGAFLVHCVATLCVCACIAYQAADDAAERYFGATVTPGGDDAVAELKETPPLPPPCPYLRWWRQRLQR